MSLLPLRKRWATESESRHRLRRWVVLRMRGQALNPVGVHGMPLRIDETWRVQGARPARRIAEDYRTKSLKEVLAEHMGVSYCEKVLELIALP